MKIKNIIGVSLFAGISSLAASCYRQEVKDCWKGRENLLEEVMLDKPQAELNSIKSNLSKGDLQVAQMQHKIDSIVFSDMFAGSQYVKDSNIIADYKRMMAKTQPSFEYSALDGLQIVNLNKLKEQIAENVTVKEMKNITRNRILPENGGTGFLGTGEQFLLDSICCRKFLEESGLLNAAALETFNNLCDKVRP